MQLHPGRCPGLVCWPLGVPVPLRFGSSFYSGNPESREKEAESITQQTTLGLAMRPDTSDLEQSMFGPTRVLMRRYFITRSLL